MKRRKNAHLDLLVQACQSHLPVRLDADAGNPSWDGTFLSCDARAVTIELSPSDKIADLGGDTPQLRAHFGHRGRRYSFRAMVIDSNSLPPGTRQRTGLKLTLPVVVCERPQRRFDRIIASTDPATLVHIRPVRGGSPIETRLHDLAPGGLSLEVPLEQGELFQIGGVQRAQILPPDPAAACETLVRVVHITTVNAATHVGFAFVGQDDATEFDKRIKNLQDWMVDAQRRSHGPAPRRTSGDNTDA